MMNSQGIQLLIFFFFLQVFTFGQDVQKADSFELALNAANNSENKIEILLSLTDEFINNDPVKALEYVQSAYTLSEETKNERGKLKSMLLLAEIHYSLTELITAFEFATKAIELAEDLNMIKEKARANSLAANILMGFYELDKCLDYIYESLKLYEEIDDKKGIANSFNAIGVVYYQQHDLEKALEYFLRSYTIGKEINRKASISGYLNNIANVYNDKGEYETSIRYYLEAVDINKKLGNRYQECINYHNLGINYKRLQSYELSLEYYLKALDIANDLRNHDFIASFKISIANYYLEIDEPDKSSFYALEVFETSKKFKLKKCMYDAAKILNKYFVLNNDLENAYKYATIQYQMKDSLDIEESIRKITRLELQYEFEKIEQINQSEQQRKESIYLNSTIIIVSFFVIIIVLLVTRHRIKVKNTKLAKKEIESKLEIRNKELTINVMSLMRKNEMLTDISKELYEIKNKAVKEETKEAINKISRKIIKSSESEIWEEFELRFKQVHGKFYESLTRHFPNLSPSEQRLCAFLRLNMSTKEISELTGQSLTSLEKARYRLRKKLNISNSRINLITFLSQL